MEKYVTVRFYAELNDFLPSERRQIPFQCYFSGQPAVKDLIESLGVPHTEIDLILINGQSVDFFYKVRHKDFISVYPVFESLDISPVMRLRPAPLREPRFVLDTHLGKLTSYLRMLGFDALYHNKFSDEVLARISAEEKRTLLTRDRGLLKRSNVVHGYLVRSNDPPSQLLEVLQRFDLHEYINPFKRCLLCNEELKVTSKEEVEQKLPQKVKEYFNEFYFCLGCGKVYWKGSHYERMRKFIHQIQNMRT